MRDFADLLVDAACALGCATVLGLLVAATSEVVGWLRDLLPRAVGW